MAYQEFTGQLDGEQPAAAAPTFMPFDGQLDSVAQDAPKDLPRAAAAPKPAPVSDDSAAANEAAMTDPMGNVTGSLERVAQPEDKNQVGLIASAARAFPESSAKMAKVAGLAASAPAVAFDYVKNAITGGNDTTASDSAFKNFVEPWDKRAEFFAIKPEEKQNIIGKIGSSIGSLGADLPYMIMSGGIGAEGEAALQILPKTSEYLAKAVARGFDAMRPVMIKAGSDKAEEVLNKGGSLEQATAAATTAAMLAGFMGSAPMSVEGQFFKRLATGVPIGAVTSELGRQIQNTAMPTNMQQPFDAENLAVGSVTNAAMAGAMGHPAHQAMPERAELGYLPSKTTMADAVSGAYTGMPAIIGTARGSLADIGAAKTMDDVIAAASAAVPDINPDTIRASNDTAIADLLKAIRPIDQGVPSELPTDAVPLRDDSAGSAQDRPQGMDSAEDGRALVGAPDAGWKPYTGTLDDAGAAGLPGTDHAADQQPALKAADAGLPIDDNWHAFPPNSGTLGIPRADMPQIKAEHRGPMVNFLEARGVTHEQVEVPAESLKPTQQEFSPAKVEQARAYTGGDRSILVSSDGHVVDGHHQWLAALEKGEPVKAIRLNAPIRELLPMVREFPSAEVADGAEAVKPASTLPGADILAKQPLSPQHGDLSIVDTATLGSEGVGDKTISAGFARFTQALGKSLGKEVYFFRQDNAKTRIDGFAPTAEPGAVFINIHAGDAGWHYVAGHEFFHQMPEDLRTHFIDAIKPLVKPDAFTALKDYINQPHLNDAGHWEEIAADLFGNRFGEKDFFDKLLGNLPDRSTAARVMDYIRQFIDKMTEALGGAGKQFKTDRFVEDLDKVRAAAADALGRYLRNEGAPQPMIGGKLASEFSDKEIQRLSRSKGNSGDVARKEIERRAQAAADMKPAQRRQKLIDDLTSKSSKELRDIAENHVRSYLRNAAAELLHDRQAATSAKRSASVKKFMKKHAGVDVDQDSMATAIVKMGGVNRESAEGRLRLAPEELNAKANFGNLARNLFVKGKGRRMDEMGELLADLGYVDRDAQGKHDQRDFEDKLAQVAGGEEIHTPQALMHRAEAMRAQEMEQVHAESADEFDAIERYADELEDWAEQRAIDLSKDPDLDNPNARQLLTEEDINAYFGSSEEERARSADQENPGADASQGAQADRAAQAGTTNGLTDRSWVIKNKKTGEIIMETFDRKKVDALNTEKYEAVPIRKHLGDLNDDLRRERGGAKDDFELSKHDANDLKAKDARDNDQALADRQLADSQRDGFTLTAPDGTVTGEAKAMANKRQEPLFSNERDEKALKDPKWYADTDDMMSADLPNGWRASIYHGDGKAELTIFTPDGREFGPPVPYADMQTAVHAAPGVIARRYTEEGITPGSKFSSKRKGEGEQEPRNLLIQHNLSASKLLHADRMGGLPVPSLAITRKEAPLQGFGEITLIGSRHMADPKGYAKTKVHGADIYSPRYPSIEYQFTPNMRKRLEGMLLDGMKATDQNRIDFSELERDGSRELERQPPVQWRFLKEHDIEPKIVRVAPKPLPEAIQRWAGDNRFTHELAEDPDFIDAAYQAHEDMLIEANGEDYRDGAKAEIEQLKENARNRGASNLVTRYARDVERYNRDMHSSGAIDKQATRYAMEKQIREADLQDRFEDYTKELFEDIAPNERIFQGHTNAGNRRYIPHTLENVTKILKKELRGGEGWNYGVGSIRAHYTPQFKSIKDIQANRDRIIGKKDFETVKNDIDNEFQSLISDLASYHSASEHFGFGDTVSMVMSDAAKIGLPRALKENGFDEVPEHIQAEMRDFMTKLRNLPTEYFEAKIVRPVALSEFSGAVIPHDASDRVRNVMDKHGLKTFEYQRGDEGARTKAITDAGDQLHDERGDVLFSSQRSDEDTLHLDRPLSMQSYEIRRLLRNDIKRIRAEAHNNEDFRGDPESAEEKITGRQLVDRIAQSLNSTDEAMQYLHSIGIKKIGDDTGIKSSGERKPVFYSQLEQSIDQVPAKVDNTSAANWKAWLLNNAGKLGVKADEVKWSGITDYLDMMGKQKVGKEQIREYLKNNGVQVQEVMKGAPAEATPEGIAKRKDIFDKYRTEITRLMQKYEQGILKGTDRDEALAARDEAEKIMAVRDKEADEAYRLPADEAVPSTYDKYTLPGGENYRELLLTLPVKDSLPDGFEARQMGNGQWGIFGPGPLPENRYGSGASREDAIRSFGGHGHNGEVYKSSHWEEPNILAHVRFNDRTDADGKRVLFIEELQSDWGQEGKKKGFKFSANAAELKAAKEEMMELNHRDSFGSPPLTQAERTRLDELIAQTRAGTLGNVPNAPFVTDTKAWLSLGIKRMIRYAAENGYDKIAFVNGDQSAERYDLSKQISRVQYDDNSSGGIGRPKMDGEPSDGMLRAYDLNGKEVINQHMQPNQVEDYIGKDLAKKLFEQKAEQANSSGLGVRRRQLSGLDLKVGGEGMKSFYDKIVPQVASDVLKRLGGGKVGKVSINAGYKNADEGGYRVSIDGEFQDVATMAEAKDIADRTGGTISKLGSDSEQTGFDVTPELRAKAMQGMPLFSQKRNPLRDDYDGPGAALVKQSRNVMGEIVNDILMKASPMSLGTDQTRAIAKDWANNDRLARWQWTMFDTVLKKNYTDEQRSAMWDAADEENELRAQDLPTAGMGLDRLPPDQRATMDTLHSYAESLLNRARDVGMFQGEGVPYWTPRMAIMVGDDGEYQRASSGEEGGSSERGRNITVSASSLKRRKYLTSAETEAAMKTKFGDGAQIVRDIRTMPLAMARLERAIAGRELVNQIRQLGTLGTETVSSSDRSNFFTLDHPAFKTFKPRMTTEIVTLEELTQRDYVERDGQVFRRIADATAPALERQEPLRSYTVHSDGSITRMVPLLDAQGNPIFDRVPIYISKDFEGPLRAIMSDTSGKLYQSFMSLKTKTMGLIMYSPLIHNAVEWGRALPMMPGKVATFRIYFEGNRVKNDPVQMRQAILDGMVPIGHRGMNQDLVALMSDPTLLPGKSWTAKLIGGAVGMINEHAGTKTKQAIDKLGEIWHQTLLWDRVGDLQAGLYSNLKADLIGKGMNESSAGKLAAHFANRYAGALPNEAMSVNARKIANFVLFSRSFTLGNLGAMKDIFTGMPKDVQAQIRMESGEAALKLGKSIARKKAGMAFALDIALLYAGNSILQDTMDKMKRDKSLGEIGQGYVDRFQRMLHAVKENPLALADPFFIPGRMASTADNEPGKEDRIHFDNEDSGTAVYMRMPTGKIGEEFKGWTSSPLQTLLHKQGTIMRPITQTIENDKGFGRRVYNPDAEGIQGAVKNLGRIVWNIMSQQIPADSIQAGMDWAAGKADSTDKLKAAGPLLGLTFSKGAPGGPAVGEQYYVDRKHQGDVMDAMPDVQRAIKQGDTDKAIELMEAAKMTPAEMLSVMRRNEAPESRLNKRSMRKFNQHASDEDKDRMDRLKQ